MPGGSTPPSSGASQSPRQRTRAALICSLECVICIWLAHLWIWLPNSLLHFTCACPVARTLRAPAPPGDLRCLWATSSSALSGWAHPAPLHLLPAGLGWLAQCCFFPSGPSWSNLSLAAAAGCFFNPLGSQDWGGFTVVAQPGHSGLTASAPFLGDSREQENSPTCSPLLPGSSALHRLEVETRKEKKNVQTPWMLG